MGVHREWREMVWRCSGGDGDGSGGDGRRERRWSERDVTHTLTSILTDFKTGTTLGKYPNSDVSGVMHMEPARTPVWKDVSSVE